MINKRLLSSAALILWTAAAVASPVSFSITGAAYTPGSGYGQDANEANPNLLDVRFSTSAFAAQNFTLSGAGAFTTFTFGTIAMWEPDGNGGITANEMDDLAVTAALTFATPVGTPQTLFATGTAIAGSVTDSSVDYTIDWKPIDVSFGNGGLFKIELNDLGFTDNGISGRGQVQTQTATITLVREFGPLPGNTVPEPSTIALAGIALLGSALFRRKSAAGAS